jgi:hypothetical protein
MPNTKITGRVNDPVQPLVYARHVEDPRLTGGLEPSGPELKAEGFMGCPAFPSSVAGYCGGRALEAFIFAKATPGKTARHYGESLPALFALKFKRTNIIRAASIKNITCEGL